MADNNFDVLIRILTQQVGSEKAQDILKKVEEQTKKTTVASVDFSKTQTELEKNVRVTTTSVNDLTIKKKELHNLARLLPEPIRAIGSALKFAFSSPLVAVVAGLLFTINRLSAAIGEAKQKLDVMKLGELQGNVSDIAAAAARNATNWNSWEQAISAAGTAADDSLGKIRAAVEASGEIADAQFDLARAKVEADPSLTPEQKQDRLASINQQQGQSRTSRGREIRKAEIAAKERELNSAKAADEYAFTNRKGLSSASEAAAFQLSENQGLISNVDADIARLEEKMKSSGLNPEEYKTLSGLKAQREVMRARNPELEGRAKSTAADLSSFDKGALNQLIQWSRPRFVWFNPALRSTGSLTSGGGGSRENTDHGSGYNTLTAAVAFFEE